jgi:hypothetical protein
MSYTLRGRIESRLASALPALLVALGLHTWWAVELVALMLAIGLVLDALVYDRVLAYQPGWAGLPLGALELGLVYASMHWLGIIAPLRWALALYATGWLAGQVCAHGLFPRARLEYGESGGELGRGGALTGAAVAAVVVGGLGGAYATRPPTVHLHGTVQGPLVIRHPETLTGGTVLGGIIVRSNKVTIRNVTVIGGENGVDVEHASNVMLDHVRVLRTSMDAIHVRDAGIMIENCTISNPAGPWVQGVDISYSMGRAMSMVSHCTIAGVHEGIVTHSSEVDVVSNRILDTTLRGISLGEMSMGMASGNEVSAALGVGILCEDHSMCQIEHNVIAGTRVDGNQDRARQGVAVEVHYYASAQIRHNTIVASPGGIKAFDNSTIER